MCHEPVWREALPHPVDNRSRWVVHRMLPSHAAVAGLNARTCCTRTRLTSRVLRSRDRLVIAAECFAAVDHLANVERVSEQMGEPPTPKALPPMTRPLAAPNGQARFRCWFGRCPRRLGKVVGGMHPGGGRGGPVDRPLARMTIWRSGHSARPEIMRITFAEDIRSVCIGRAVWLWPRIGKSPCRVVRPGALAFVRQKRKDSNISDWLWPDGQIRIARYARQFCLPRAGMGRCVQRDKNYDDH